MRAWTHGRWIAAVAVLAALSAGCGAEPDRRGPKPGPRPGESDDTEPARVIHMVRAIGPASYEEEG